MRFAFVATFAALVIAVGQAEAQLRPAAAITLSDSEILFFRRSEELRATAIAVIKSELKSLRTSKLSRQERRERKLKLDQDLKRLSDKKSIPVPAQLIEDVQPDQMGAIPAFRIVEGAIGDPQQTVTLRRRVWRSLRVDAGTSTGVFSGTGDERPGRGGRAVPTSETDVASAVLIGPDAGDVQPIGDEFWTARAREGDTQRIRRTKDTDLFSCRSCGVLT